MVCPVSWHTTRRNSLSEVPIVKPWRFIVCRPDGMSRMSVPR
jgi:hypothetical protein